MGSIFFQISIKLSHVARWKPAPFSSVLQGQLLHKSKECVCVCVCGLVYYLWFYWTISKGHISLYIFFANVYIGKNIFMVPKLSLYFSKLMWRKALRLDSKCHWRTVGVTCGCCDKRAECQWGCRALRCPLCHQRPFPAWQSLSAVMGGIPVPWFSVFYILTWQRVAYM